MVSPEAVLTIKRWQLKQSFENHVHLCNFNKLEMISASLESMYSYRSLKKDCTMLYPFKRVSSFTLFIQSSGSDRKSATGSTSYRQMAETMHVAVLDDPGHLLNFPWQDSSKG